MMPKNCINRRLLVNRHEPVLINVDVTSPMPIGNGDFVFSADVTGLQTLFEEYGRYMPLCTMAQWGWHSVPNARGGYYTVDDVVMEEFDFLGRKVRFALNVQPGNEEPYNWLRKNPHRFNLARIALKLDGNEITKRQIRRIRQHLHLYEGYLESHFMVEGIPCTVLSACDPHHDVLAFRIESELIRSGRLTAELTFPYGDHHIGGALWDCPEKHQTERLQSGEKEIHLRRQMDRDVYFVKVTSENNNIDYLLEEKIHSLKLIIKDENYMNFCVSFSPKEQSGSFNTGDIFNAGLCWWRNFWETGAAVQLSKSRHPKAIELERRIILSQYVLAIQSAGSLPPAETGLTCNSWYGKFHLEMHLWHAAYLPLWNHTELLERSIPWYHEILLRAKWNAERNGFKGARWPKMVGPEGIDSPSFIATLLLWQQPHILYMLELMYHAHNEDRAFIREHWPIIRETADFMADLPVYNEETGYYDLTPPLIPAEENEKPMDIKNPAFELTYWKFGLKLAIQFAERLGEKPPDEWVKVYEKISPPPMRDGLYIPHEWFKPRHPEFKPVPVGMIGLLPGDGISKPAMREALSAFMELDNKFMIGWTFPYFAMCATRLGMREEAIELLLMDHPNNTYVANGNNSQGTASSLPELPLYLPGNGGLLLGIALMAAGYPGSGPEPGFPDDGQWVVETDGLMPFPF